MKTLKWVLLASLGAVLILFALTIFPAAAGRAAPSGLAGAVQNDGDVWIVAGEQAGANLGQAVAEAGDVNGDGFADLLVSARAFNGSLYDGRAMAFYGSATGLSAIPDWDVTNDQAGSQFARVLAAAGDVNGDGYDDVLVGETYWTDPETGDWGRVSLFLGSATGLSNSASWTAIGNPRYGGFGAPTTGAGDVNGDGYDDFMIAEPSFWGDQDQEGRVYLYHGGPDGPGAAPAWTAEGNQDNASYGNAIGSAGDVNDDGYGDVIIAAYTYDGTDFRAGRAYVYHGSSAGLSSEPQWIGEGNQYTAHFGISVDRAYDANGDGFDDVLVGSLAFDDGQTTEGRGFLFAGGPDGVQAEPMMTVDGDQERAYFSSAVAGLGDVDGNGIPQLAFGAPNYDWVETDDGIVMVLEAGASSPLPTPTPAPPTPTPAPPTPTPTPSATMHVADLDAATENAGSTWSALVTVRLVTSAGEPVSNANIRAIWTRNGTGLDAGYCATYSDGTCAIPLSGLRKRVKQVTFQVDTVTHPSYVYDATANTDPDGDSDGTSITVQR